jgi:ABC-type glycerol-3-phosphate transport system substrate-binding protein
MSSNKTQKSKKITRREFIKTSALLGAGLVAAQCAPPAAPQAPAASSTQAPEAKVTAPAVLKGTTITVWSFFAQPNYQQWYKFIADEFTKTHPDVTVNVEYPGFDLITKAKAAIGGGEGIADVYALLPSVFGLESFRSGLLVDLTPYYQKDEEWQSWTDLWARVPPGNYRWPHTPDGAIYSSNESLGPSFVWYWADMFDKLGGFPETIDGLLEAAAQSKSALPDLQGLCSAGFAETWHCDYWYYCLEAKYDFSGAIARKCVAGNEKWSSPKEIRQGLELWERLHKGGLFTPGVIQENYDPESKGLLKDRQVAMFYSSGPWMSGYLNPGDAAKIGTAYFPKEKADDPNTYTANNDMGHVIWKISDQQKDQSFIDLRVEFIKSMASPDSQRLLFKSGIMPVWSKASDQPIAEDDYEIKVLKQQIDLMINADYGVDNNTYFPNQTDALDNGMVEVALGIKTIDNLLTDLDAAQAKDFPS